MKNDPIVINQANLTRLQTKYAAAVNSIDLIKGKVHRWGTDPTSEVNISNRLPLQVGGGHFGEGLALSGAVESVRASLVSRFTNGRKEIEALQYAMKWLLLDTYATEHLATLSGADFEHFIPTGTSK